MTRLFGTDGIRGVANEEPLTTELAFRLGRQLVATLLEHHGVAKVRLVVGRDTRLSGPMLEAALVSGALSAGADVFAVSVLPTPGIAYLTRSLEAHGGVALSASHNAFQDNGIKIFSSEGAKFPDSWEDEIEARLGGPDGAPKPTGASVGRLVHYDRAETEYIAHARQTFPFDLGGLTLALDCAHGATCRVAPRIFRALGARVVVLAAKPDGLNINRKSGALHPERLQRRVLAAGADLGLAFDGDGDRLIAVDETGEIRDGDYALAVCGRHLAANGRLKTGTVVTTVMANLGLDKALAEVGIRTIKTQVGDRYVLEEMVRTGANLGGEQSGHLLFLDHTPTGDGIVSALQLLAVMRETGQPLSALASCMSKFPQVLVNVRVREKPPFESIPGLADRQAAGERELGAAGRILLRYSGTENLARVMIEGEDRARIERIASELSTIIRAQEPSPGASQELIAMALLGGRIKMVSLTPDGRYRFLDDAANLHEIFYTISSETLDLQRATEELEALMNNVSTQEKAFQDFFERHPDFILNDEYRQAHSKVVLTSDEGESFIPDFILEPIDQNTICDLLELKTASAPVFVLQENRARFSAAVLEACAQLRQYSGFFDSEINRKAVYEKYGLTAFRPRMFVIIGRRGTVSPLQIRQMETDLPSLRLRTYDDVLARMKAKVDAMENRTRA